MTNRFTAQSTLVDALLGAGSYGSRRHDAPPRDDDAPARAALQAQAEDDLRLAQVELYCDHDARALIAIHHAMQMLEASRDETMQSELAALGAAAWHVRRHDSLTAAAMLERSRARLHG
ncbi:hypothetical protein [Pseudorhodoferax sp.]|uniref:hypothetical protein n=1 Tax=Pseudorhodoferax sp. TaxID=1993553 RepID=UPI0039E5355E